MSRPLMVAVVVALAAVVVLALARVHCDRQRCESGLPWLAPGGRCICVVKALP